MLSILTEFKNQYLDNDIIFTERPFDELWEDFEEFFFEGTSEGLFDNPDGVQWSYWKILELCNAEVQSKIQRRVLKHDVLDSTVRLHRQYGATLARLMS